MGILTGVAIYFVIWWTLLFAILPIGVRSQAEEGDIVLGTTHSAPANPRLAFKALLTTIISGVAFGLYYIASEIYGLGFHSLPHIIPGT